MDLDKIIIALEKQGWKVDKDFFEKNEEYLQDFANEAKKQALSFLDVSGMYSAEKVLEMLESVDDIEDAKDLFRENWIE